MKSPTLPPGPATSALGQTLRFLKDPFSLIAEAGREHGDIFSLRVLGLGRWVFLGSPALVKQMFKAPVDALPAGEVNRRQLGFMLGEDATFSLDGTAHRERQRIVHPLLNGRGVHRHVPAIRELAELALAGWREGEPFALVPHTHRLSLDALVGAMFCSRPAERRRELADLFDRFASRGLRSPLIAMPPLQVDLGPISPWGRIQRLRRQVRATYAAEVDAYLSGEVDADGPDVLLALIRARQRDGAALGAEQLVDEVINLLFAGHETTGAILAWAVECICTRPEVLARVRAELDEVLGGGPIEAEHLDLLPYLEAAINESIRYRPLAPMAGVRVVREPLEIGGYLLPEGTLVAQCFPAMARRGDLWEEPESYRPEHFFGRKLKPFEWNPFGGGTRMCIGRGLAEMELKVVLATLLPRVDFTLAQERVAPVRNGIFFTPNRGLRVVVERRR